MGIAIAQMCLDRVESEVTFNAGQENTPDRFVLQCLADNEVGDARLFNMLNKGIYIYDHSACIWYIWEGHSWREDTRNDAMSSGLDCVVDKYGTEAMCQAWCATKAEKSGRSDEAKKHTDTQKAFLARIKVLQGVQRRRNVLTLAAAGTGLTGCEWDRLPMVLTCPNGIVDLTTGEQRPGEPEDYLKTTCPTEYLRLYEPCLAWEQFLSEVFTGNQEIIEYVQRLLGYGIAGKATLHILPILWGAGRNGKGTLLETIKYVVGDYAYKTESELLLDQKITKTSGSPNSAVLALRGKRIIWASETDEGRKLNTSRIKELVGGDTLSGRAVYGRRHVEFRPSHLLMLLTNNKPQAPAGDFALWQRIHLIPFTQAFVANPTKPNEHKVDPDLPEKLRAEAAGILAWLVRGCIAWQSQGLNPPESVTAATRDYRAEEDLLGHFLEDCCVQGPTTQVKAGKLYKAYQEWAEENGHRPMSGTRFGKEMKSRFDSYRAGSGHWVYIKVGISNR